jgi:predicted RNase H-like HicB family nuclease
MIFMAVQTLLQHYLREVMSRVRYRYEGGSVTAFVPELPGLDAEGSSEHDAEQNYFASFTVWMLKQLNRGRLLPVVGEVDLNSQYSRNILKRETGIDAPAAQELMDPDQAWFWTPESQAAEDEAWQDVAEDRGERFDTSEAFLASFSD